jgi:murein DD-endopeptidase MepM/ murein hydrolase activator NlpD
MQKRIAGKRRTMLRGAVAAFVVASVMVVPVAASAGSRPAGKNINNQLYDASQQAVAADARAMSALRSLKGVKSSLLHAKANLKTAARQLNVAAARVRAARSGERAAQAALVSTLNELAVNQAQTGQTRHRVAQVARELYIEGTVSSVDILLSSTGPADYEEQVTALSQYSNSQTRAINDLKKQRLQLDELKKRASAARAAMARQNSLAKAALADAAAATASARNVTISIRHYKAAQDNIYRTARADKARLVAQIKALQKEAARLAAIERARAGSYNGPLPTGELTWPTHGGTVTEGAGPRIHPIFHTKGCHTGVDIGQPYGADVLAAAAGTAYTEKSVPYGNVILVVHGAGLSTMYAHLSRYNISNGQQVKDGQVIGFIGSTGWSTGPHLHFEVHINGVPWDPMGWFGKPKRPVPC